MFVKLERRVEAETVQSRPSPQQQQQQQMQAPTSASPPKSVEVVGDDPAPADAANAAAADANGATPAATEAAAGQQAAPGPAGPTAGARFKAKMAGAWQGMVTTVQTIRNPPGGKDAPDRFGGAGFTGAQQVELTVLNAAQFPKRKLRVLFVLCYMIILQGAIGMWLADSMKQSLHFIAWEGNYDYCGNYIMNEKAFGGDETYEEKFTFYELAELAREQAVGWAGWGIAGAFLIWIFYGFYGSNIYFLKNNYLASANYCCVHLVSFPILWFVVMLWQYVNSTNWAGIYMANEVWLYGNEEFEAYCKDAYEAAFEADDYSITIWDLIYAQSLIMYGMVYFFAFVGTIWGFWVPVCTGCTYCVRGRFVMRHYIDRGWDCFIWCRCCLPCARACCDCSCWEPCCCMRE